MDNFSPSEFFNLYKQKKIGRDEFVKKLLMVCEFSDSKQVRLECLEIINSESKNDQKIFNTFEEIALTDSDSEIRLNAIKNIIQNFPNQSEKSFNLIRYLIENSLSLEFVMNLSKVLGENIFSLRKDLEEKYSKFLKHIIMEIFEREDVKSFEIIWGDWFNEAPHDFWRFMSELNNPIGLLEILDYFLNYYDIYKWFFKNILSCYNTEQWIGFFNNPKFSGRMLYLLIYLAEEENPQRLFQIVEVFEELGKIITDRQTKKILDILRKNNLYDFTILIIFRWLESLKILNLKFLLEDRKFNLISNLAEVVKNNRFGFIKNDYFLCFLFLFLLKIHRNVDERFMTKFFNEIPLKLRNLIIFKLMNMFHSSQKKNGVFFEKYLKEYNEISGEVLKILSRYLDTKKTY